MPTKEASHRAKHEHVKTLGINALVLYALYLGMPALQNAPSLYTEGEVRLRHCTSGS